MLSGGREGDLGVIFGVLRHLEVLLRHGPVFIQVLGSIELLARQKLVGDGLAIGVEASRNVIAAHAEQQLLLLHRIAKARVNPHHAARGQRDHRHVARDVRIHRTRHHQLRGGGARHGGHRRKLFRMIDGKKAGIREGHNLRGRRRLCRGVAMRLGAADVREHAEERNHQNTDSQTFAFHKPVPSPLAGIRMHSPHRHTLFGAAYTSNSARCSPDLGAL